ncbi:NIPSNAP family protein [Chengkuizengella axinellae]|uniref:NIPSNAP family protein n=1 Tax=Chengkuizengella axinellae TaxID=3064388 RepID=A0ABT9J575_9BACL|nr:NIPSNAP family protein [Chengkuizengella sp. 2205SS18-9]MDP5276769.1 NIPSNAP family protein [Chengkuizengella sp. 2205SS18-9]
MIYRRKTYKVDPGIISEFNQHFNKTLLPTQIKYGAKLVGRWMTEISNDEVEIFAIWEYKTYEDYLKIENQVRSDKEHVKRVQSWFDRMGGRETFIKYLKEEIKEDFIESTVLI